MKAIHSVALVDRSICAPANHCEGYIASYQIEVTLSIRLITIAKQPRRAPQGAVPLQQEKYIRYSRGHVEILDLEGLRGIGLRMLYSRQGSV
ncbi:MAG TPA: hypothetical protein VN926_16495 [Bradyrhizobium sp.]|jgi:hypothetical protein|nr:hypothetical protein [Bradyrhizobium sp.]